jgi:hypothetical protein
MNDAVNRGRRSKALFRQAETRAKGLAMDALILRHKEEYKALYTAAYKEEFNDLFDEIMVDGVLESSHA